MKYSINTSLFTTLLILVLFAFKPNYAAAQAVPIEAGTDVTLAPNTGFFQLGRTNGWNIVMDNNEIQGRDNGNVNVLTLNNEGGDVRMGGFTKLGLQAPAVKTKLIEVTATANQQFIVHGVDNGLAIISGVLQIYISGGLGEFWTTQTFPLTFSPTHVTFDTQLIEGAKYRLFVFYIPQ